ncbi:MAG: nucleotidyltransferase [Candidatus Neomarinimicrobiota bacterium]
MIALLEAVREVQAFLEGEGWSFMVIGGLAVQVWGGVRATEDVDISVGIRPDERDTLVKAARERFKLIPDDPEAFIARTNVLPIETESGIPVDLICAGTDMEREAFSRARDIEIEPGFSMRVATAEDLVLLKFISERPRDREDVEGILFRSGKEMDHEYVRKWLRVFAETLHQPSLVEEYEEYLGRTG